MSYGKLRNLTRTVAFRLTLWYAGVFTGSTMLSFIIFYLALLRGIHHVYLSPKSLHELLEAYWRFFGTSLGVVALCSVLVGWLLARRALAGVRAVTHTALSIAGDYDLDRRVPVKGTGDEVDQLAVAFNDMLGRIARVLCSMKEITENIAHDLRSPITRMRGVAEMALCDEGCGEAHAAMAGSIVEECDALLGMINTMLDISEAEAGLTKPHLQDADLATLLRDLCDLFQPLAEDKKIAVSLKGSGPLLLACDLPKLQRVFANLLDNALKYTPSGGHITVSLDNGGKGAVVTIEDTGPGISEEDLPLVFDRFFRSEKSRSEPGSGLGLSLAQALVLVHKGTITAASEPGHGARFTVTLPVRHE